MAETLTKGAAPMIDNITDNKYFATNAATSMANVLMSKLGLVQASAGFLVTDTNSGFDGGTLGNRINIKYFSTDRMEEASANYNPQKLVGRSSPVHIYSDGNAVNYSFTCWFLDEELYGSSRKLSDFVAGVGADYLASAGVLSLGLTTKGVMLPVRWLKSLVYPVIKEDVTYPPVSPIFVFGEAFSSRVLVTRVSARYYQAVDVSTLYPSVAEVTVNMIQNTNEGNAFTQKDIMSGLDTNVFSRTKYSGVKIDAPANATTYLSMAGIGSSAA